jgi:hypothetical protein
MKAAPRRSLRQSLIAALVLRCNKIAHVEMVYEHQRRALRTTEGANESELIRYVAAYARRGAARRGAFCASATVGAANPLGLCIGAGMGESEIGSDGSFLDAILNMPNMRPDGRPLRVFGPSHR